MKKLILLISVITFSTIFMSSCKKDDTLCHHHGGSDGGYDGGSGNTGSTECLLEPYKSAIIFNYAPQGAFKNDGLGYAKTETSGNVAVGPAATYKVVQIWLWTGSGFVTDYAGIDNHGGSTASLNHQIDGICNPDNIGDLLINTLKLGSDGMPINLEDQQQFLVVTLSGYKNTDGTTRMAGSTNSFDEAPGASPERLRLDEGAGFDYEITGYKIKDVNDVFTW